MATKTVFRSFLPLLLIFIITNGLFVAGKSLLAQWNIDFNVLFVGNLVLFVAAVVSFLLFIKSFSSPKPQVIVRTVYSGVLSKMMICLIAVFIYIAMTGKDVNKGGVIGCMVLYLVYTFVEVVILMKLSKKKQHV